MESLTIPFVALAGVSGVGKSHLLNILVQNHGYIQIPSVTTRDRRLNETEGYDKFFVSEKEFYSMEKEGKLVCVDTHFGYLYGTNIEFIREALENKHKLVGQFKVTNFNEIKQLFNAYCVYILPNKSSKPIEELSNRQILETEKILRIRDAEIEIEIINQISAGQIDCFFTNTFDKNSEEMFIKVLYEKNK